MESLERILVEYPFLRGMKEEHMKLLVGCASNVRFDAGKFILREGEEADLFYLIREGTVAIEFSALERGAIIFQTVGKGEVLGWSWLVPPYRWRFDARAVELTRAIALDGKCLRAKCESDCCLGYELFKRFSQVMASRLQAARLQFLNVYENR